jgi:asparagine synthase (glutamine-hydrolysing)
LLALEDAGWNLSQAVEIAEAYYAAHGVNAQLNGNLPPQPVFLARQYKDRALRFGKQAVKKILGMKRPDNSLASKHPRWQRLGHLNQQLYVSTHETILPTLLRNYDRYSMANGVEIRMPFMDHRIVALAFALPWTAKVRGGFSKAIVRDAMACYMPRNVAYRKTKIGFNSPIVDWMQGPLRGFLSDTISSRSFTDCRLIDPAEVTKQIQKVMNDPGAKFAEGERAWTMLSPYLWERAVVRGEGRA